MMAAERAPSAQSPKIINPHTETGDGVDVFVLSR